MIVALFRLLPLTAVALALALNPWVARAAEAGSAPAMDPSAPVVVAPLDQGAKPTPAMPAMPASAKAAPMAAHSTSHPASHKDTGHKKAPAVAMAAHAMAPAGGHGGGHGGGQGGPPHWDYSGKHEGPAHWADLDPAFETCAKGMTQSPIDIRGAVKADLPALQFSYNPVSPTFYNNGHTIQVNIPPGNFLTVGDNKYELLQFHFHAPSEEAINGKKANMVAHFVHKTPSGALGVIGVLLVVGKSNPDYAPVFAHMPKAKEKITVDDLSLDLAALLPSDRGYYNFAGSLTTPPCSEGVNWMVMRNPVVLGSKQILAFRKIFMVNARPLQPTNGREIKESR